jgi:hypothetical protein
MKNIILIVFGVLVTVFVIFVRIIFSNKLEIYKQDISVYENTLMKILTNEKQLRISSLQQKDDKVALKFNSQFSLDSAKIDKNAVFRFLYLKKRISYNYYSINYIECLISKCELEIKHEQNLIAISKQKERLIKRYGEDSFNYWFDDLKDKKLLVGERKLANCQDYFKNYYVVQYKVAVWNAFEALLRNYNYERRYIKNQNNQEYLELERLTGINRAQLYGNALDFFNNSLSQSKNELIKNETIKKTFQTAELGDITFYVTKEKFRKDKFDKIAADAFEIQWSENSLSNGSMPYAYCYGASNTCFDIDCSKIKILNGGTDVVVIIKTINDNVIRHAFVKAGYTFTFNLPNGMYNVYFYSGTGWDPYKILAQRQCTIRGGFVKSESTGKDTDVSLYNQALSYQLKQVVNGNFSMESSSKAEVFN